MTLTTLTTFKCHYIIVSMRYLFRGRCSIRRHLASKVLLKQFSLSERFSRNLHLISKYYNFRIRNFVLVVKVASYRKRNTVYCKRRFKVGKCKNFINVWSKQVFVACNVLNILNYDFKVSVVLDLHSHNGTRKVNIKLFICKP